MDQNIPISSDPNTNLNGQREINKESLGVKIKLRSVYFLEQKKLRSKILDNKKECYILDPQLDDDDHANRLKSKQSQFQKSFIKK